MYVWLDQESHDHAKELIEEAERRRLARALRDSRQNERPAGRRSAHDLADWIMGLGAGSVRRQGRPRAASVRGVPLEVGHPWNTVGQDHLPRISSVDDATERW
jgi:hypothetical protein